jgi:integrase
LTKKLRDGCYRIDFRDEKGQRFRFNYPTKKAADDALTEYKRQVRRGEFVVPRSVPKFEEVAVEWLKSKSDRRPGTVVNWRAHVNRHLVPRLGTLKIDRIGVAAVENLQAELRDTGLRSSSVAAIRTTLSAIFDLAIRRCYLSSRNPVDDAQRPFAADSEIEIGETEELKARFERVTENEVLDPAEIRRLLDAAEPGLYRTVFTTAALTGLRSGELFGLRWGDVELGERGARGRLLVRRTLTWARTDGEEGPVRPKLYPPKTRAGIRDIPIPAELSSVLRTWKLQCPRSELDLVFATPDGKPIRRTTALRCGFWPALRRAKLRQVNMHSLRHSYASILIMGGASVTEVGQKLGHSSPKVTFDVYSHWFKGVETDSVDRLARTILVPTVRDEIPSHGELGHFLDTPDAGAAAEAV